MARRGGGYTAEPARNNQAPSNLPPAIGSSSGAPQTTAPSAPANPPQTVLGSAAPGSNLAGPPGTPPSNPTAPPALDSVAPTQVPVPQLGQAQWSRTFPDLRSPAIVAIGTGAIEKLQEGRRRTGEWIGDQLKDQAKEKATDSIIDHLPLSAALKDEIKWQGAMIERYKKLYEEKLADTKEYLLGWSRMTREAIQCLGSTRISCDSQEAGMETVKDRYADRTSERWKPWLKEDFQNRLPVQQPREP